MRAILIETERLHLKPMTVECLKLYTQDYRCFCAAFGIQYKRKTIEDFLKKVFTIKTNNIISDPENWIYYTYFLIINKSTKTECGLIGFKGLKDCQDTSEVGYGIDPEFRRMGIMSEALNGFCLYFLEKNYLSAIKASVLKENLPSIKVLEKAKFRKISENERFYEYLRV